GGIVRYILGISGMIASSAFLASCGTRIDAGSNSRKHQEKVNLSSSSSQQSESGYEGSGSCFGAVDQLPDVMKTFCQDVSAKDKKSFKRIYQTLCVEQRLANLILPECGWNGEGGDPERAKYLK